MSKFLYIPVLLVSLLSWSACQDQAPKTPDTTATATQTTAPPADTAWIVANQQGEITLFGLKTALEQMKKGLQDSLVKLAVMPDRIPLRFEGEVLMGMRGEIETETMEAIGAARASQHPPVMNALRVSVEKEMTVPVSFAIQEFRIFEKYAYVAGTVLQPDGQPMNYRKTPLKELAESGDVSGEVYGLLKMENGAWKVITQSIGALDMPVVCWWQEFKAPKALFPPGLIAEDCISD